jgi:hypothetical protein
MTKILILVYDFPPYVSVGSLRPYSWYKYLHLYGVYPIIVTRQWNNKFGNELDYISPSYSDFVEMEKTAEGTIIKAPFKPNLANKIFLKYGGDKLRIVRKLISAYYEFLQFLLPIGNKKEIYLAANEFLKQNKVDYIIASGDPFVLFKYASKLSAKYSIPWIADYRDAWIQDKSSKSKTYKLWCSIFEKRFLQNVIKITTVSTFIQKQIEQNIKGKHFEILFNGYDPQITQVAANISQSKDTLTIAFAGTIYDWHPIESFIRVCNESLMADSDFKLRLNFYGINKEKQVREILSQKYKKLEKYVSFYSRMDNLKLAEEIAKQNACLLFNDYSILGTKIFDYLAVRRKILLCYENDDESIKLKKEHYCIEEIATESNKLQSDMIEATNSGIVVKDSHHLKRVLKDLWSELKENGFISCPAINVEKYSRVNQVEKLAEIIKEVSQNNVN